MSFKIYGNQTVFFMHFVDLWHYCLPLVKTRVFTMSMYVPDCIKCISVAYQAILYITIMKIILIPLCIEVADAAARTTVGTIVSASWGRETATARVCVASPARVWGDSFSWLAPRTHHHRSCQ